LPFRALGGFASTTFRGSHYFLESLYTPELDSQYLYHLGSPGGPAIPPDTGCSF
jgi:hypothetical protein